MPQRCLLCTGNVGLIRFPNAEGKYKCPGEQAREWQRLLLLDDENAVPPGSRLCYDHFDPSDFVPTRTGKRQRRGELYPLDHVSFNLFFTSKKLHIFFSSTLRKSVLLSTQASPSYPRNSTESSGLTLLHSEWVVERNHRYNRPGGRNGRKQTEGCMDHPATRT